MDKGIDTYISLHFKDLEQSPAGGQEEFVAKVAPGGLESLNTMAGVTLPDGVPADSATEATITVRAGPDGQRRMSEADRVLGMQATRRRPSIPVLIQLRQANWDRDVPGLEKGSRLGRILSAMADERAIRTLAEDPDVISVEASRGGGLPECVQSMPWIGAPLAHAAPLNQRGAGAMVAVIDGGIDVLHEAFRDGAGRSRIRAVWDQRDSTGRAPSAVAPMLYANQTYGTLHTRTDIDRYIAAGATPVRLGRDSMGHGTHVASIAAGSPFTASYRPANALPGSAPQTVAFPGGVAPEADIVVVIPKLEADIGDPQSLGYSKTHIDALAFIRSMADDAGMPVAVNVSLGMNAGAHDGTSLLELGFDAFTGGGRDPGYVIVKSAGNEFGHGGHAFVRPFQGGMIPVVWTTKAASRREDYLEFWFPSSDDLVFTIVAPTGLRCTVDRGAPSASAHDGRGAFSVYASLTQFHADNGDSKLLIVVRNNAGGAIQIGGEWRLEILGRAVFSERGLHGWVEREDAARAVHFDTGSVDELTLSIPGTARTVITVGACEARDPLALSRNSSRGPTRDERLKPELVAPGVEIVAAKAGTTNELVAMTGTSMAAPHVTGAAALLLAHRAASGADQLNAVQIRAALSQSLNSYNGRWQAGFGNGRLDVVGLLRAFA
ncbi:S8 family serine peptidase [Bosea caraganae]|nr:S8 family serine peptidase [Bosea caraganae]